MSRGKIKKYLKENPDVFEQAGRENLRAKPIAERDIPPEEWLTRNNPEFHANGKRGRTAKRPWYKSKGLWIPVTACLALALLFGTTNWGQATASTAYKAVVQFFAGGSSMEHGKGDKIGEAADPSKGTGVYRSLDEVKAVLGKRIAYNTSEGYHFESIQISNDGFTTIVETAYQNAEHTVIIKQTVLESLTEWSNTQKNKFKETFRENLADGTQAAGYFNGTKAYAAAYKSDMLLEITSDGMGYDAFCAFIRNVHFK